MPDPADRDVDSLAAWVRRLDAQSMLARGAGTRAHVQPYIHATPTTKSLHFSISEIQSRMNLLEPDALELEYTRTMMGFVLFHPSPQSIGLIGLGGGSLAKFCHRHLRQARILAAEINPHVIALRDDFHVPPDDERLRVVCADGAGVVRSLPEHFDILLVDGFSYDGLPRQLATRRFFADCFAALKPGGILVVNMDVEHEDHPRHCARMAAAFGTEVLRVIDDERCNGIAFASKGRPLSCVAHPPAPSWPDLQDAFDRILAALEQQALPVIAAQA